MKCSRCDAKAPFELTIRGPKSRKTFGFCPFHAERIEYIIRVYIEAPGHTAKRNP